MEEAEVEEAVIVPLVGLLAALEVLDDPASGAVDCPAIWEETTALKVPFIPVRLGRWISVSRSVGMNQGRTYENLAENESAGMVGSVASLSDKDSTRMKLRQGMGQNEREQELIQSTHYWLLFGPMEAFGINVREDTLDTSTLALMGWRRV